MDPINILLGIVLLIGFYLAFNIGANDVANVMGTSVGSRSLSISRAVVVAAVFEFLGAVLLGDEVSKTIKQGFVDPVIFAQDPMGFAYGMTAAILASALWLQYATFKGFPVSTTHSIVGAVLGFAVVHGGLYHIKFGELLSIFTTWIFSPLLGGFFSYFCLLFILRFIIDTYDPLRRSKFIAPAMICFASSVLSTSFTLKVTKAMFGATSNLMGFAASLIIGLILATGFYFYINSLNLDIKARAFVLHKVENIFGHMQVITACFLAFAHGSNDVANAIGPAAAIINALLHNEINKESSIPYWLLLLGAIGIVSGFMFFGRKVIDTVGKKITEITPTRGFAAEFGAAFTILFGSALGIPLSTTHILVGSVIGVGLARGMGGIDVNVIKSICRSWVITIPASMSISMFFCLIIKLFT